VANYHVALTSSAEKELKGLPSPVIARIAPRLENLVANPRPPGCKKLKGGDKEWRIRFHARFPLRTALKRHGSTLRPISPTQARKQTAAKPPFLPFLTCDR
jgi:hypothetical protein